MGIEFGGANGAGFAILQREMDRWKENSNQERNVN